VHLKSHQKSLIPFNYQFRVLRSNPQELEHRYSASGTNIQSTSFGGVAGAGTYDINTAGQAFSFSESSMLLIVLSTSISSFWNYCCSQSL
jgi:hypothetical protein